MPRPDPGPSGSAPDAAAAGYTERLWPSPLMWLVAPGLGVGVFLSVLPLGFAAGVVAAVVVAAAVVAALAASSPTVRLDDTSFAAGRASVPTRLLGDVAWARGEGARQERGPRLDARAFLLIRGWVDPVVRVALEDPDDPTPYWLVSTRRPEELAAALTAAVLRG